MSPEKTPEQEQAVEALCLRDGGFLIIAEGTLLVKTPKGRYLVSPSGTVSILGAGFHPPEQGLRPLLAEVYGRGESA